MVPTAALAPVRKPLAKTIDRLALPCAHLAGVYFDSLPERDRPRYILPSNASSLTHAGGR